MKAHFVPEDNLYYVRASLREKDSRKFNSSLCMVFDSGAADTIISTSLLYTPLMLNAINELDWDSVCRDRIRAKSSFGEINYAYKVCLNKIRLSGVLLDNFYCYLVPDLKLDLALLGNDFLNYCDYKYSYNNKFIDFVLHTDDYNKAYGSSDYNQKLISLLNSVEVSDCDDTRDLAAAFRYSFDIMK